MTDRGTAACRRCRAGDISGHRQTRHGLDMATSDFVVALSGNPNVGKSTVFNALTGLRQHTGNWPGKTVARAEGVFNVGGSRYKLVDLPGTYSLLSTATDEEIARDFILFGRPDVTIVVVDASRLERNLNLALQVMEITERVVVALNLIDEAKRHGMDLDDRQLARDLGVPVVPMVARQKVGVPELRRTVHGVATGAIECRPHRIELRSQSVRVALDTLEEQLNTMFPDLPSRRWVALRLLDGDPTITEAVRHGTIGELVATETSGWLAGKRNDER